MNVNMWENAATQGNIEKLKARGVRIVEPDAGYLACGMTGPGRLAANDSVLAAVMEALGAAQDLAGETVLVTAGPTREKIDPVRYIGNRSSGRMGYALAEAALRRGARVILITGPVALKPPAAAEVAQVESAEQMRSAVLARAAQATVVIKAAAVADFTVKAPAAQKMKRKGALNVELQPTTDILAELGALKKAERRDAQLLIGFAAETENALENARQKLRSKAIDAVVVNDVSQRGIGFDSERNAVTIITSDDVVEVPETSKWEVAHRVLDAAVKLREVQRRRKSSPANISS
jgi:phosphopantothenoylcysteine decarboxylase / phosphopantothenate---cysteine ligase